ncbi:MAG: 30S ribosomal protein S6 [Clostridia bacterium]|nr:30S ribosomal protein S6 [Clostridia bacterium]
MEKITSKYEVIFVVDGTLAEEAAVELINKFKGMIEANATIDEVQDWGKKRLAYPINDVTDGYYTLVHFTSAHDFPAELERNFNITDGILRALVVKAGE